MQNQDLVTLVPWTFIAQICNLFIQMLLIKKFLIKPVREIIEKRRKLTTEELDKARESRQEADALKTEYEESIAGARNKANEIIASANKSAQEKSDEIISRANAEAVAIKTKASADIEQQRKAAFSEIKDEIGSMAVDIAEKIVEREISEEDNQKLIGDFIENVGEN